MTSSLGRARATLPGTDARGDRVAKSSGVAPTTEIAGAQIVVQQHRIHRGLDRGRRIEMRLLAVAHAQPLQQHRLRRRLGVPGQAFAHVWELA